MITREKGANISKRVHNVGDLKRDHSQILITPVLILLCVGLLLGGLLYLERLQPRTESDIDSESVGFEGKEEIGGHAESTHSNAAVSGGDSPQHFEPARVSHVPRDPCVESTLQSTTVGFLKLMPFVVDGRLATKFDHAIFRRRCFWLKHYIQSCDLDIVYLFPKVPKAGPNEKRATLRIAKDFAHETMGLLESDDRKYTLFFFNDDDCPYLQIERFPKNGVETKMFGGNEVIRMGGRDLFARIECQSNRRMFEKDIQEFASSEGPIKIVLINVNKLPVLPKALSKRDQHLEMLSGISKPLDWVSVLDRSAVKSWGCKSVRLQVGVGKYGVEGEAVTPVLIEKLFRNHREHFGRNVFLTVTMWVNSD